MDRNDSDSAATTDHVTVRLQALTDEAEALEIINSTGALVASELNLDNIVQAVTDAGVRITGDVDLSGKPFTFAELSEKVPAVLDRQRSTRRLSGNASAGVRST